MEKELSFVLLSLQEMTLSRIAVVLWNKPDILASIGELQIKPTEWNTGFWRETVQNKATDKISELKLPEPLMEKIIPVVKAVGVEIKKWKSFHEFYLSDYGEKFGLPILEKLHWTSAGTVDRGKTAKELIYSHVLDVVKRYKLACLYCLEDDIREIWNTIPKEKKGTFYNEEAPPLIAEPPLYFCWPYILQGQESKLGNVQRRAFGGARARRLIDPPRARFYQYAFEHSSCIGNKTAAEYFFQKLTQEQRNASLVQTALYVVRCRTMYFPLPSELTKGNFPDVLCYLLSQMTPEERMQVFNERPCEVLRCFMEWPWQNLFSDIADVMWDLVPESKYKDLLNEVYRNIQCSGYYIPSLLRNLLLRSRRKFGKQFLGVESRIAYFFETFFDNHDTETIKVIFRSLDSADRATLLFHPYLLKRLYKCISNQRWLMVEVCIQEAKLSKEDKDKLKENFSKFEDSSTWGRLLHEAEASNESKRSSEEEESTTVKKLCCGKEQNSTI